MHIIKLDATPSTNTYLKQLLQEKKVDSFTVVQCAHQTKGRGQQGNSWVSDSGKNLTASVFLRFNAMEITRVFELNCMISVAIFETLSTLNIPQLRVKWPNDIMSVNQKLCGILIENSLKGSFINHSVIGFGLNVNQLFFDGLPHATSLALKTGQPHNIDQLLLGIVTKLKSMVASYTQNGGQAIVQRYQEVLFRKDLLCPYEDVAGNRFRATLKGVSPNGQLQLQLANGEIQFFGFKEVKFIL